MQRKNSKFIIDEYAFNQAARDYVSDKYDFEYSESTKKRRVNSFEVSAFIGLSTMMCSVGTLLASNDDVSRNFAPLFFFLGFIGATLSYYHKNTVMQENASFKKQFDHSQVKFLQFFDKPELESSSTKSENSSKKSSATVTASDSEDNLSKSDYSLGSC